MRISDWSSDVCSSDLDAPAERRAQHREGARPAFSAGQRADAEDDGHDEARSHRESADRLHDEGHGMTEESRVGKGVGRTCRIRWSQTHKKKQKEQVDYRINTKCKSTTSNRLIT